MKNLKVAFFGLVLGCVSFAGVMASANSGHIAAPQFRSEPVILAEQMIVGSVQADMEIPLTITAIAPVKAHKIGTARTPKIAQVRVTDLEQGGSPTAGSVIRYN